MDPYDIPFLSLKSQALLRYLNSEYANEVIAAVENLGYKVIPIEVALPLLELYKNQNQA